VQWNCNGISNKIEMLKVYEDRFKPHIISLNELKLITVEANKVLRLDIQLYLNVAKGL
jgi:hypothetical protein